MEQKKNNRRNILAAIAVGGASALLLGKKKAEAAVGEENVILAEIAAVGVTIKETIEKWKKEYDKHAKTANEKLSFIGPIKSVVEDAQKVDEAIRKKKQQVSRLSNKLQRGIKDPASFRFPSIDPFTTDILDSVEYRYKRVSKSISKLTGSGKEGRANKLKTLAKQDAQINIGTAAARIQRNELEKLKKVAARNAKDNPQEDINAILTRTSTPYMLETIQQLLEGTRQNGELLSQILQTLDGNQINTSTASLNSISKSVKDVKEGRGTFIEDKGDT